VARTGRSLVAATDWHGQPATSCAAGVPVADPPRHVAEGHLLTPLPKDAELVAFGICQYHPRHITLANVDTLRTMSN
jgi:hypothetical protein